MHVQLQHTPTNNSNRVGYARCLRIELVTLDVKRSYIMPHNKFVSLALYILEHPLEKP